MPTTILLKVNCNKNWGRKLREAGIPLKPRTLQHSKELGEKHEAEAQSLGRNAFAVRNASGRSGDVPEDIDSGTPIFGPDGFDDLAISIMGMPQFLEWSGYQLTNVHLLERAWKAPIRLVMEFSKGEKSTRLEKFPGQLISRLLKTAFNQVDVWANPKQPDGKVTHTVNCGRREDAATPQCKLTFDSKKGDWNVAVLPVPVAAARTTTVNVEPVAQ